MKSINAILIRMFFIGIIGCNFIDVVPEDAASLDHAFSNRAVAYKFLNTCYSHLPDPTDPFYYPAYFTSTDEFVLGERRARNNSVAGKIAKGLQSANDPLQDYWSGRNGGKPLYVGIRDCNIFLENIHKPQDILEMERQRWIAEVKFLKAYYHFFLMKLYGPIVLINENLPISSTPEETHLYREPIDRCVNFIVSLLDEAISELPLSLPDVDSETGRIDKTIALAIKAKVLIWAASPLFNGNSDYSNWIDNRGEQLISSEYDSNKWEKAAEAIKEAIDACHEKGARLYEFNKLAGGPDAFKMNDSLVQLMTIRKVVTEDLDKNSEVIWATQEQFADGKGGATLLGFAPLGDMLRMLSPALYPQDVNYQANYYAASLHMGDLFYSNNGVPIEEDVYYDYEKRYEARLAISADKHQNYIATGEITAGINFDREPRYYANLGFDRGFFELATTTENGGENFLFWRGRPGEVSTSPGLGSYVPKKLMNFESRGSQGDQNKFYSPSYYQFPLIRLADLYLMYSEALNELKAEPDDEVYKWIDKIRKRAGLKGVLHSWENFSKSPDAPKSKSGMRKIIRKERLIELAFEGHRFWDIRRWKMIDEYWTLQPIKWSSGTDPESYYQLNVYDEPRVVAVKDYFYPISEIDLRINPNLIQTYGW